MKKPTPVHAFHLSRAVLFLVVAATVMFVRGSATHALQLTYDKAHVLAYASSMNMTDLLSETNKARAENGLSALSLNAELNSSAQMKANDMITNNYWSHVSPTGIQPWYWFDKAGYVYVNAGENLAYGFNTGAEVVTAWMNSPSHKANIVGDYNDIGFGIANGGSYQGGEYTVVVAHYGKPQPVAVAVPTVTSTQTQTTTPQVTTTTPAPVTKNSTTPTTTTTTPNATPATTPEVAKTGDTAHPAVTTTTNTTSTPEAVSILDQLRQGKVSTIALVGVSVLVLAGLGFVLTHRLFFKHLIQNGMSVVPHLHHPVLDLVGVAVATGLILSSITGYLL